jgi:hypothetical protein
VIKKASQSIITVQIKVANYSALKNRHKGSIVFRTTRSGRFFKLAMGSSIVVFWEVWENLKYRLSKIGDNDTSAGFLEVTRTLEHARL